MALHRNAILGDRHAVENWQYADAAARTAAVGFVAGDVGKIAYQLDNKTYWRLTAVTPTWVRVLGDVVLLLDVGDETTALAAGTGKKTIRSPFAFTLTNVRASVTTAPTGATLLTIDVKKNGTTVFSTTLTFDAGEKTTVTATTPAVISAPDIFDDDEITVDIVSVGSTIAGAGLKIALHGYRV